jgi:uncharacterized protein
MSTSSSRPLALVTGASTGIGLELAKQFASNGFDLVISAHSESLDDAVRELEPLGAVVEPIRVDLASADGVDQLWGGVQELGRPLAAAALNAGRGAGGAFTDTDLTDELEVIDLNVRSTVQLAKHVVREMAARGEGRILFTSSIASTMPGSFQAVYNASKSFVQAFALALGNELKDRNVTVTALMPGPTDTEFFATADMLDTKVGADDKDDPADVARDGFEAMMAGKERVVSASLTTKVMGRAGRFVPDGAKAEQHRKMAEPCSAGTS